MAFNVNIFYSHKIADRLLYLNKHGELISTIKYYGFIIDLYTLDKNFIEVYRNRHNNKIEEVEVVDPFEERLNLFAVRVDLSALYKK